MLNPRLLAGVFLGFSLVAPTLWASSQTPITAEAEAEVAAVVCVGEATGAETFTDAEGRIFTRTVIRVAETLKGICPGDIVVVTSGGTVGGRGSEDGFSARFERGKSYLLHLAVNADGTLTPLNGKSSARRLDRAGTFTKRFEGKQEAILNSLRLKGKGRAMAGHDARAQAATPELLARVAQTGTSGFSQGASVASGGGTGLTDGSGAPHRFINFEQGQPIRVLLDMQTLPTGITPTQATTAVQNALNAWAAAARVTFLIEGTANFGQAANAVANTDGRLRIQMHDNFNAISNANTTLGIGGSAFVNTVAGLGGGIKGKNFDRTTNGFVILDHAKATLASNAKVFEEVLCHEIGHALGLDHSSESDAEANPSFAGAMMYFRVLNNNRGATLTTYDINKIREVYPVDNSPPYSPDRVINVVTATTVAGANVLNGLAGVNEVNLAGTDRETASGSLTATLVSQRSFNANTDFSLSGTRLRYSASGSLSVDEVLITDDTSYDDAYVRLSDGVNFSPMIQVRTVSFARDTKPSTTAPDGLPDAWALLNAGAITALAGADADGDGLTNLQEFYLGTNPRSANSMLRPTFIDATTMKWSGSPFVAYRIDRATTLTAPVWTTVGHVVPLTAADAVFQLPTSSGTKEFYRIVALP